MKPLLRYDQHQERFLCSIFTASVIVSDLESSFVFSML